MENGGSSIDGENRAPSADGLAAAGSDWIPSEKAFKPYMPLQPSTVFFSKSSSLRIIVKKPLVARLSKEIVETYKVCNPNFKYSEGLTRKRFLSNPSVGVLNDGFDNANSDLILHVNFVLDSTRTNKRYVVKDLLGQGTFGQVAKCWVSETNSFVAVKIIKNQPAYYQQALVEVSILQVLNDKFDPDDKNHIVRILEFFVFRKHLCITFEMLGSNLYELIRMNQFKGLSLSIVQTFSKQILDALVVMRDAGIIHCDLKPENILISTSVKPAEIKVIDFGSACLEGRTVYSYIQSRYYRSPEVLLGYPYTTAIDMWSFGCIVAELFLGLPLFPGASEFDLLKRMIEILGGQPPDQLLRDAKNTNNFFKHVGSIYRIENTDACKGSNSAYKILTEEECEARDSKTPAMGKRYFSFVKLEDIIAHYPYRKNLSEDEISKEGLTRLALVDFLRGLVEFDPEKRWSPLQASGHPFVTGEPFSSPYKPAQGTQRIPVTNNITVDHNPGGGHWLVAGLSPQVLNVKKSLPHNSSNYPMVPFSHGSYGSIGSHGSYNENTGLGSSFGSYGDVNYPYHYHPSICPSGLAMQSQIGGSLLGASPDTRRRPPFTHGNGFGPSPGAGFGPMSLGASPSQFTPPSAQMHMSTISPGKYGPTSPARGNAHGSPLGKGVTGQYNRRQWQHPGTSHMLPYHDHAAQVWQVSHGDGFSCNQSDHSARGSVCSPRGSTFSNASCPRQQWGGGHGFHLGSPSNYHNMLHVSGSMGVLLHSSEASFDKAEVSSSPPDPADCGPNYSDELLFQEDNSEESPLSAAFESNMNLGNEMDFMLRGSGQSGYGRRSYANSYTLNRRIDGAFQGSSHAGEVARSRDSSTSYVRMYNFNQNSPTRFSQQSAHRHMQPSHPHNDWSRQKPEPSHSNYGITESRPQANNTLGNGLQWGRRTGHPIATILPSSHARKDYGRIT